MSANNFVPSDHTFAVCAYRESPYLEDCILSLKNQTIKSNIIMTTSTPCEKTEQLSKKYDIPLFINEDNPGIASDWNFAFQKAKTSLITIAHQDDIYESDYVSQLLYYINMAKDPIIYFCGYFEIRQSDQIKNNLLLNIKRIMLSPLKRQKSWSSIKIRRKILSFGCPICCPSVTFVKKKCGEHPFNTKFKCALDWEQWESLSGLRGDFVYNPNRVMRHRIHPNSETSAMIHDQTRSIEDFEIFKRFWPESVAKLLIKPYCFSQKSNKIN